METLSAKSGGGGNGGGGGVIRTGGTWGWTGLVSKDSGESGHGSVPALLGKHGGPPGACVDRVGLKRSMQEGDPGPCPLVSPCLPMLGGWVSQQSVP